jgi:hypothetical protein
MLCGIAGTNVRIASNLAAASAIAHLVPIVPLSGMPPARIGIVSKISVVAYRAASRDVIRARRNQLLHNTANRSARWSNHNAIALVQSAYQASGALLLPPPLTWHV